MKILVLNCGSSSVKFELFDSEPEWAGDQQDRSLAEGSVQKIGTAEAIVTWTVGKAPRAKFSKEILDHRNAIETLLSCLTGSEGPLERLDEIEGVGHRVVHGGERFTTSVLIDQDVVHEIEEAIELAPLHNPSNLTGYFAAREALPGRPHVAVFDTSFHQTMPAKAFLYGLPYMFYKKHQIRRYGFHGTSHRYVSFRYSQIQNKPKDAFKLVSCHLGNGCSMCAMDGGKSIDTSMGFTPLEGLLMGTRSGDLDPAVILHIMAHEELHLHEAASLLNKHSGLYGLSGTSNDMRTLIAEAEAGDQRAQMAIDVFCYRAKKYLGAYLAALNGADAIIFTGGIGENAPMIRAEICASLEALGIVLDAGRNEQAVGKQQEISKDSSRVKVWVIPTDEELVIARDTTRCILGLPHQ